MNTFASCQNYVAGKFLSGGSGEQTRNVNPANGRVLCNVPESGAAEVDKALDAARVAQEAWAMRPAIERAAYLHTLAGEIRARVNMLSDVIVAEQGKIRSLARVEVRFTADYIDYMAEWARRIEGEVIESDRSGEHIFLYRKPMGVVVGILPWNFPFFLIARKMAPALVTGNTIVVKPSEEAPSCCLEFAKLVDRVGIPKGVFNVVFGMGHTTGRMLSLHGGVDMISFTGSVATGSSIMRNAAKNITKVNLELGGKAPAIVLADANVDLAVQAIRSSRIINSGQVCNCAERVYVERGVADEFMSKVVSAMGGTRYGDPGTDSSAEMGPLINREALEKVSSMVDVAQNQGAEVCTGGHVADVSDGFYYEPTVLGACTAEMDVMTDEVFGPVLPVQVVDDLDEAIMLANESRYGLTSSIYTESLGAALKACRALQFGETYVNRENFEAIQGFHAGSKKSGIGGADGKHGLYEFTQTQVVYIQS